MCVLLPEWPLIFFLWDNWLITTAESPSTKKKKKEKLQSHFLVLAMLYKGRWSERGLNVGRLFAPNKPLFSLFCASSSNNVCQLWHSCLGHLNAKKLLFLLNSGFLLRKSHFLLQEEGHCFGVYFRSLLFVQKGKRGVQSSISSLWFFFLSLGWLFNRLGLSWCIAGSLGELIGDWRMPSFYGCGLLIWKEKAGFPSCIFIFERIVLCCVLRSGSSHARGSSI